MPYVGSYIWKIRQKIGHDTLIMPAVEVVAVNSDGKILMVFNKDWNGWIFPGGYIEQDQTWSECAVRELEEEAGLRTTVEALVPFAFASGHTATYPNGDITQPFSQLFLTKSWEDMGDNNLDTHEVSERKWLDLRELSGLTLHPIARATADAYEAYRQSGEYRMIDLRSVEID